MKVILTKDVQNLGHAGDVKEVSGGYAKNFLIPGGFARVATAGAMKKAEEVRTQREEKSQKDLEKAKELADKMQGETVTVQGKADPSKKLYASIKPEEIAQALQAKGYEVDKSEIVIGEPIKELGEFEVAVRLEHGLEVNIGVIVEAQ